MILRGVAFALAAFAGIAAARAEEPVDLELVLALDCSYSVDDVEFRLQKLGLAAAFREPAVQDAIAAGAPHGVVISVVLWSGAGIRPVVAVPWTAVRDRAGAAAFAGRIEAATRAVPPGPTAIGEAMAFAAGLIEANGFDGRRRVIDLSGDGRSNQGERPAAVRDRLVGAGLVVNGLAIENEEVGLYGYFVEQVIGGPGAFALRAADYADFARAIAKKLIREIGGAPIADLPDEPGGRRSAMLSRDGP